MLKRVFRRILDNCWLFSVAFITHRHISQGYAPVCPMFRLHSRLLRNTPFQFHPSYPMRSPSLTYLLRARHVCHRIHRHRNSVTPPALLSRAAHSLPCSHTTNIPSSHYMSERRPFLSYPFHYDRQTGYQQLLFFPSILDVLTSRKQYKCSLPSDEGIHQHFV